MNSGRDLEGTTKGHEKKGERKKKGGIINKN